jgi:transposase
MTHPPPPLTDLQFHALLPYLLPRSPAGRPIGDLRARMDAIFHVASGAGPWADLPERFGRPDTVSRYFRRLTRAGLWQGLLIAIKESGPGHPLQEIAPRIFRACRRAARLLGLPFLALIRRLRLLQALPGPPAKVADPALGERWRRSLALPPAEALRRGPLDMVRALLRDIRRLHGRAKGVNRLRRHTRLCWE